MEITVYGELESAGFPVVSSLHSASSNCLTKCMHNLLIEADSTNADLLLLVGSGKEKLWCHRCILGARSDVFKAMLTSRAEDQTDCLVRAALGPSQQRRMQRGDSSSPSSSSPPSTGQNSPASQISLQPRPLTLIMMPSGQDHNQNDGASSTANESKDAVEESKLQDDALSSLYSTRASFLESQTGVVIIPDGEYDVMKEFLVFLYTDALSDVNVLGNMANKLLAVSSKYQVPALFNFVEEYLCLQLSVETALEALRLADTFMAPKLKEASLKIVVQNALMLADSAEYKSLHSHLQEEIERLLEDGQRLQQCCLTGAAGSQATNAAGATGRGQCSVM